MADLNPGPGDSDPGDLIVFKNSLVFRANEDELWMTVLFADGFESGDTFSLEPADSLRTLRAG